jgi:hypothetical protein
MDRRDVLNLHDSRMKAREALDTDVALAKTNLRPQTQTVGQQNKKQWHVKPPMMPRIW